jgi:hypothetical protein
MMDSPASWPTCYFYMTLSLTSTFHADYERLG